MNFTQSHEPSTDYYDELIVEDRTNYDSRKQAINTWKVISLSLRLYAFGTTLCKALTNTSRKTPMTLKLGLNWEISILRGPNT